MYDFYNRHKLGFWLTGGFLLSAGAFATIWATAGTSLPFIAGIGAKLGLDLGFLSTWATPAASAAAAGIVTGATFLSVVALKMTKSIFSGLCSAVKCCFCSGEDEASASNDNEFDGITSSHTTMRQAGMTSQGTVVGMDEEQQQEEVQQQVVDAKRDTGVKVVENAGDTPEDEVNADLGRTVVL